MYQKILNFQSLALDLSLDEQTLSKYIWPWEKNKVQLLLNKKPFFLLNISTIEEEISDSYHTTPSVCTKNLD